MLMSKHPTIIRYVKVKTNKKAMFCILFLTYNAETGLFSPKSSFFSRRDPMMGRSLIVEQLSQLLHWRSQKRANNWRLLIVDRATSYGSRQWTTIVLHSAASSLNNLRKSNVHEFHSLGIAQRLRGNSLDGNKSVGERKSLQVKHHNCFKSHRSTKNRSLPLSLMLLRLF